MRGFRVLLLAMAALAIPAVLLAGIWWWAQVIRLMVMGVIF